MRRTRITATVTAFAISALALAGCSGGQASGTPTSSGDSTPIKVVVLGGIGAKGILANNATTSVTAAQASVAAINDKGGILGRKVQIQVVDDTGDPTVAVTKLRELMAGKDKPDVVLNSGPSTVTEAMLPIVTQNKVLSFDIGPTATSGDPKKSPYNFDLSASVPDYINSFVDELKNRKVKKVAILHGSSAYGELFGTVTKDTFAKEGMTVTGDEGYDIAALDMTPQIEALQQGKPDVLVLDAYGAPLGYVLQGIEKLGWDVPILGNTSVSATGLIATEPPTGVLGTSAVKNLTMQVFTSTKHDAKDKAVNDAVAQMKKAGDIKSSLILAYNYDSMFLVKAAAEKAGKFDAAAIAKALVDPEVQKAAGTAILSDYAFTADSHTPHVKPGDFLFIEPGPLVDGQFQ